MEHQHVQVSHDIVIEAELEERNQATQSLTNAANIDQTKQEIVLPPRPLVVNYSMAIPVWFFSILFASIWLVYYPAIMVLFYLLVSAVTFFVYAFDASANRNKTWRIDDTLFHALSLIGGWSGALLGQCIFNHKYSDKTFAVIFWCTAAMNFLFFVWTLTESGSRQLEVILGSLLT
ncbi:DUF1294 domain-containing protein [Vibrio gallaecicus]|uniref:DUF1294 domain-containing protein n=1 Tax=Vibrio gallaecicus TaxID=552386 RepID=A0ABV4N926_9VIBR